VPRIFATGSGAEVGVVGEAGLAAGCVLDVEGDFDEECAALEPGGDGREVVPVLGGEEESIGLLLFVCGVLTTLRIEGRGCVGVVGTERLALYGIIRPFGGISAGGGWL